MRFFACKNLSEFYGRAPVRITAISYTYFFRILQPCACLDPRDFACDNPIEFYSHAPARIYAIPYTNFFGLYGFALTSSHDLRITIFVKQACSLSANKRSDSFGDMLSFLINRSALRRNDSSIVVKFARITPPLSAEKQPPANGRLFFCFCV